MAGWRSAVQGRFGARFKAWSGAGSGALRRVTGRLRRRGVAVAASAAAVLLVVGTVAVPALSSSADQKADQKGRKSCGPGEHCPDLRPWLAMAPQVRRITPVEAATQGQYVALGDSYSAGEGAYDTPGKPPAEPCHRTGQAYPQLVAKTFPFAKGLAFWACSGARTYNLLDGQNGEPPQLNRLNAGTSLVTLTIGGNDTGFANVMAGCVVKLPFTSGCTSQSLDVSRRLEKLRGDLRVVYGKIVQRAPNARVIVLGYPRLFSEASSGTFNISVADQQWLNARGRDMDQLIRQVVQDEDKAIVDAHGKGSFEYVDAYSAFAGHEVGGGDPDVNGLDMNLLALTVSPGSFHPNAHGYQALAALVDKQIQDGPGRPILQYR